MKSLNDEWEKNQITDELLYYCFQCQIAFLKKMQRMQHFLSNDKFPWNYLKLNS